MEEPAKATTTEGTETPGYTRSSLFRELLAHVGMERGIVRTFVDTVVRPGVMLRKALKNEAGSPYVRPVPFLLLISGAWWFIWLRFPPPFVSGLDDLDATGAGFSFLLEYGGALAALNVIPLALGTSLVLRPWKRTFVEHLVMNAYVWSAANGLVLLAYPLLFGPAGYLLTGVVNTAVAFLYYPFAVSQLGPQGFPPDFPRAWLAAAAGASLMVAPLLLLVIVTS